MKDKALLYSVVTTQYHYDEYIKYQVFFDCYDYLLFVSDNVNKEEKPEGVKLISFHIDEVALNYRKNSRQHKINAIQHKLLSEYEYCIYHDSNICILESFQYQIEKPIGLFFHNRRKNVFQELLYCLYLKKVSFQEFFQVLKKFGTLVFRKGLYQGGVILRNNKHNTVAQFNEQWSNIYYRLSTDRDQISLALTLNILGKEMIHLYPGILHESKELDIFKHNSIVYNKKE